MRKPIGFFTWAHLATRAAGIEMSRWPLVVAVALDLAVIAYVFLAAVGVVGYYAQ